MFCLIIIFWYNQHYKDKKGESSAILFCFSFWRLDNSLRLHVGWHVGLARLKRSQATGTTGENCKTVSLCRKVFVVIAIFTLRCIGTLCFQHRLSSHQVKMPSKKKKYNSRFPPARIKKIMQSDEEVGKVAQVVPIIVCKLLLMILIVLSIC